MREKVPKIGGHPKRLPFQKEITKERNVTDSAPEVPNGEIWGTPTYFSATTSEAKEHILFAPFGDHFLDVLYQSILALDQGLQFRRTQVLLELGSHHRRLKLLQPLPQPAFRVKDT